MPRAPGRCFLQDPQTRRPADPQTRRWRPAFLRVRARPLAGGRERAYAHPAPAVRAPLTANDQDAVRRVGRAALLPPPPLPWRVAGSPGGSSGAGPWVPAPVSTSGAAGCDLRALVAGTGPGLYVLPSTVGYINHDCTRAVSPAYSLFWRPRPSKIASPQDTSPGPVYFLDPKVTRFGRSCTPAYSMQGRGKSRGLEVTPGPGAYSPEKVAPVRHRTPPAFTLGSRLRPQLQDTSAPAPNTYTLPSLWGSQIFTKPSSPSYTVAGRTPPTRPPQDPAEIPGPGQYDSPDPNTYRQRRPAFTMLGRPRATRTPEETPGPGAHRPEQVTMTTARAPAFTMGIRHSKRATTMGGDTMP
uniref:Outer dense fiber protein 3-like protein 2 n=2 Tax=Otariidae TaxID=9702 RepID=A0A3Q7N611_CALUR|nr:outer dense fiber protein 3-like protein 2 [Callorhinus ursinus]